MEPDLDDIPKMEKYRERNAKTGKTIKKSSEIMAVDAGAVHRSAFK